MKYELKLQLILIVRKKKKTVSIPTTKKENGCEC